MITLSHARIEPLETLTVRSPQPGTLRIADGEGRVYAEAAGPEARFTISGTLGHHVITLHADDGREVARASVRVDCETELEEDSGTYARLMHMLRTTFFRRQQGERNTPADDDRTYRLQSVTSRDTVHVHKGSLFFLPGAKDVIDLFAEHQPEDGMIWDFGISVDPEIPYHFEWRWGKRFSQRVAGGKILFSRQPVMNDLEHMFIRGLHQAWLATGDDAWMESRLDAALAAMRFSRTDPYFWSEKFELLKRPFTIDLWDYQSQYDAALVDGDIMQAIPGVSVYGVFHGDNTGMADACDRLAEMLRFAGREDDAAEAEEFEKHLRKTLDNVAWNGEFYTHHVSEDPSFERDFGVDESKQVSLSNAYNLNRGIDHDKAVAILRTYQRIRREMPDSSPAEWFGIYPPCEKGFHIPSWWYTNGGVTILTAGELARGAFVHGFEEYGADILRRVVELFSPYGDCFVGGLRGRAFDPPERTFEPLDLTPEANADLRCDADSLHPGWTDEPGNDMRGIPTGRQVFQDIPFEIIDPATNDHRSIIRLNRHREGYADAVSIPLNRRIGSLYLLHAAAERAPVTGELAFVYSDGTEHRCYILEGRHICRFWNPVAPPQHRKHSAETVIAWLGPNAKFHRVGLTGHGITNPHPERPVDRIELHASQDDATWLVAGITTSDAPHFYQPSETEPSGVPPRWGAGALMYALVEGIGGIVDTSRNFQSVRIAPRWAAAGTSHAAMTVRYADGGGYVRYRFERTGSGLILEVAGNAGTRHYAILMPEDFSPTVLHIDGLKQHFATSTIEGSRYLEFTTRGPAANRIEITG